MMRSIRHLCGVGAAPRPKRFPFRAATALALGLSGIAGALLPQMVAAQTSPPAQPDRVYSARDFQRKLQELDQLLQLENLHHAELLLETLIQRGAGRRDLLPRQVKLAQLKGDHASAVLLCEEALRFQPRNPRLLRELAVSLIDLGELDRAGQALQDFIASSPERRTGAIVAVELWQQTGHPDRALALCDSTRSRLNDSRFLSRWRASCLIALERYDEAADELIAELRGNPLNQSLIRADLLEMNLAREAALGIAERLLARVSEPGNVSQERLLAAALQLDVGMAEAALTTVAPLLADRQGCVELLHTAGAMAREAPLLDSNVRRRAATAFLLSVLEDMATGGVLKPGLRHRVLDLLAQVCEDALVADVLGDEPRAAVDRFERMLDLVKEGSPGSPHLYAAQIHLAHYTRDVLRRPSEAAARLERLLTDLDLPIEGVALARLTLGECYLAAGDTAQGRRVLTGLGRSSDFRDAAGHAHYHLARLDLAQGEWETARDRFAVVAMDNPLAGYANDALELGLAIADELDNPTGGPAILNVYARSIFFDLTAQPDSQEVALQRFITYGSAELDLSKPQYLLERALFELAKLVWRRGDWRQALELCERIVLQHPEGRFPPEALALSGRIWEEQSEWARAREAYERLLLQYPDHLFADDIRDQLRSLP